MLRGPEADPPQGGVDMLCPKGQGGAKNDDAVARLCENGPRPGGWQQMGFKGMIRFWKGMIRFWTLFILALPLPLAAQDIAYSDRQTQSCLDRLSDDAALSDCVGLSANGCMEANAAGYTTVGMVGCLEGELMLWESLLNAAYQKVLRQAKATEAEMLELGATVPSMSQALVAMQRAWMPFRDATCAYERSLWGGGTGGGPATLQCLLELTALQTARLSRRFGE
ncbi:hypothetical protein ROLI_011990 [Roseobacter fucihabitans]|uniref:Lysozyme inhibitor LprI-like N-terminal domain-containing protein n=1 Tax=Roseobacter fucihabitans TaxID=1537242 RepID=A0ABZ2BQ70_9RHOB|nr:lysozyme inhibitor LprI family protein [Roseobacter litoralis]MBC6964273.1 hypothetical protein [Roseobacter litoralis]